MEMERAGNNSKKVGCGLYEDLKQTTLVRSGVTNDKNSATLIESADIKARWAEYCSKLYEQKHAVRVYHVYRPR